MKKGLGRGLDSLFGVYENSDSDVKTKVVKMPGDLDGDLSNDKIYQLPLAEIDTNVNQPRRNFNEGALKELADSIKIHGVIQPIIVVKMGERYMIIAGERRYRASKMLGLTTIPAVIKEYTESVSGNKISITGNKFTWKFTKRRFESYGVRKSHA